MCKITVYLLHFEKKIGNPDNPYGQAQHYIGATSDLEQRIKRHRKGQSGAGIVRAFHDQGIKFTVARTWEQEGEAGWALEKKLVARHESNRLCPICAKRAGIEPKPVDYQPEDLILVRTVPTPTQPVEDMPF